MTGRRSRRVLKWTGLVLCVVIVLLLAAGHNWLAMWEGKRASLLITGGGVAISSRQTPRNGPVGWRLRRKPPWSNWWFDSLRSDSLAGVSVPLWAPLLAVAVPTFWLWRRDRPHPPGCCRNCGYDLTGTVSGVCSECGAKVDGP